MKKINNKKHIKKLTSDFKESVSKLKNIYNNNFGRPELKEIIDIAVDWYETGDGSYYSFFKKAFPCIGPNDFYGGLASFLSNCILDDSYYNIKWDKYTDGGYKRGRAWKDYPYVVWAGDEGTNKTDLMLKAMKFICTRNKKFEEFYK